jgi:hypothetical protein
MSYLSLLVGPRYAFRGGSLDLSDPVTSGLKQDAWARLINAGVLLALLVAYVVHINVASQVCYTKQAVLHKFVAVGTASTCCSRFHVMSAVCIYWSMYLNMIGFWQLHSSQCQGNTYCSVQFACDSQTNTLSIVDP